MTISAQSKKPAASNTAPRQRLVLESLESLGVQRQQNLEVRCPRTTAKRIVPCQEAEEGRAKAG